MGAIAAAVVFVFVGHGAGNLVRRGAAEVPGGLEVVKVAALLTAGVALQVWSVAG